MSKHVYLRGCVCFFFVLFCAEVYKKKRGAERFLSLGNQRYQKKKKGIREKLPEIHVRMLDH